MTDLVREQMKNTLKELALKLRENAKNIKLINLIEDIYADYLPAKEDTHVNA